MSNKKGVNTQQLASWKETIPFLKIGQKRVVEVMEKLGGKATVSEISKVLKKPNYVISPRVTELLIVKAVYDTGERRENPETGKKTTVWGLRD